MYVALSRVTISTGLHIVRGHSHIESSQSFCQNDAKFQTHPACTLHVKMPNLPKIDVYNFRYKIKVGILIFVSYKYINQ